MVATAKDTPASQSLFLAIKKMKAANDRKTTIFTCPSRIACHTWEKPKAKIKASPAPRPLLCGARVNQVSMAAMPMNTGLRTIQIVAARLKGRTVKGRRSRWRWGGFQETSGRASPHPSSLSIANSAS